MSVNNVTANLLRRSNAVSSILYNQYKVIGTQGRQFHETEGNRFAVKTATNPKPDWNRAVSEAEKIVGYPTSFLSLRWLLSDEIANVALHLRKLVGSNHPLLKTAKSLIYNGRNNMQAWGLIVLLISKAAGHLSVDDMEEDKAAGVLHSQRALAEVTEMIRTSHLVHKGLVNIQPGVYPEASEMNDMTFGNKIALLSGDYLLGNSCAELAALRNQDLVELMSSAVRDLAEAEFVGRRDNQNNPLPSIPPADRTGYAVTEWTLRNVLSAGALLGKSCQGTLKLAGHSDEIQEQGYNFGKHLALAWQACLDLGPFTGKDQTVPFSLCSAPVMFHIEHDPTILTEIDKGLESVQNVDYTKVHDIIVSGPGVELTKQLQKEHSQRAMEVLAVFEESDARTALSNIIVAMGDF
ncbi:all trans-polyprenyl-diphosphate synthase PDSS2 [Neodiprion pinetum]|uniref:All trans-polyprenyl-diphosphate synthase PDSS2 n=1 Tax=Neodiprion lecontei TaxID=441921 RepID=A0A6J0CDV3_NEOLC|nr:all trans-polyprenyl-diphosphate synthase PDSS2 [Neodiprion lecontei]XP_046409783.1 all trans-polyprenyl-diphosphate synthase PDSS2 [Neodiprion fabricii]XP_046492959.1 all trans-polyprenyl-diphosphate synthase PDSS2 [Neodiprion pinetum]XP_046629812.1 all trans-polyprenyl-diphosphate synthase PDSS2 [Neodiprion virginianus]